MASNAISVAINTLIENGMTVAIITKNYPMGG